MNVADLKAAERRQCFILLDNYAHTEHSCFLAELFRPLNGENYLACFRPLDGTPQDANRYDCRYLQFSIEDLRELASGKVEERITEELDAGLSTLSQNNR